MRTGRRERVRWLVPALAAVVALGAPGVVAAEGNGAPSVTATVSNANPVEPQTVVASATFTDPESDVETYTCTIDYGDGTAFVSGVVSGMTCTGPEHRYTKSGSYVVLVVVTDSGGASGAWIAGVNYTNVAPNLLKPELIGDPHVGNSGSAAIAISDPGSATETYDCIAVDYGDGTSLQSGTYVPTGWDDGLARCVYPNHGYAAWGTYTVTMTVKDGGGNVATMSMALKVWPSRPIVSCPRSLIVQPVSGRWPVKGTASFADANTPSAGPWDWTVSWGDGTTSSGTATSPGDFPYVHDYFAPGTYQVGVQVQDADGAGNQVGTATCTVIADNGAPTVVAPTGMAVVTEGIPGTFSWMVVDPAPNYPYAIHVDWGDGSATDLTGQTGQYFYPSHTYAASDPNPSPGGTIYTATMTVTDAIGASGSASQQVGVINVAPAVTASPVTVPEGFSGQITLASFTDASVGPWPVYIDGGPGLQLREELQTPGAIQIPYSSSFGNHTFTVYVGDRGHLMSTVSVPVTVVNVSPVVSATMSNYNPQEPATTTASATFTDAGSASETYTCTIDYGDGSVVAGVISGLTCAGPAHQYRASGSYTVKVTVTDSVGASGVGTTGVTYSNTVPWVGGLGLVGTLRVGSTSHAVAAVVDPGQSVETYTCTIDYGDGSAVQSGTWVPTGWSDGLPRCVFPDHVYSAPGSYALSAVVTDSGGASGSAQFIETIAPNPPSVQIVSAQSGVEGQSPMSISAMFSQPGVSGGSYTCTVDFGDGLGAGATVTGNTCTATGYSPDRAGTFTVTVSVTDPYGQKGQATTSLSVANIAPVVSVYDVPSPWETGSSIAGRVTFTDPGTQVWWMPETYACAVDYGDGTGVQPGVVTSNYGNYCSGPLHAYAAKGNYTFVATVTDSNGATGTYTQQVLIYNQSPTVGQVSAPATGTTGTAVTASAPYVPTGLVPADTCTVDYGDETGPLAGTADGAICTGPSHMYASVGIFTITVKILAGNGFTASSSATIQVNSLQIGAVSVTGSLTEGSSATASATFTPTGRQTYKCTVDYGDGAGALVGTISGTICKGPSHKYGRPGSFTITVTVTGSKGNTGSSTRAVDIANVMPVVTATLPTAAKVGTSVTLSASFTDPGTTETYQVVVDWGDGTRVPIQLGCSRSFTASHTYTTAGGYGVVVEVSDDQMAHVVTAAPGIAIYDPARTLSGSGTFASPAGACTFSSKCAGASTATFSVSASYARGATKPTATFTLSAAGISFTATSFEWYTVMDGVGVLYGSGKLNGLSGYRFDVYTVDGAPDKVLVNIFDSNGNSVYYNNDYTPLKTGWIVMR